MIITMTIFRFPPGLPDTTHIKDTESNFHFQRKQVSLLSPARIRLQELELIPSQRAQLVSDLIEWCMIQTPFGILMFDRPLVRFEG